MGNSKNGASQREVFHGGIEMTEPNSSTPLVPSNDSSEVTSKSNEVTLEMCKNRSRIIKNQSEDSTTFNFNYLRDTPEQGEVLNWKNLRNLKVDQKWGIIRHPFILNYINHILLKCALFYTFHVLAVILLLIILLSHIVSQNLFKDILIIILTAVFSLFLLIKMTIRTRVPKLITKWFVIGCCFNGLTYTATLAYILAPYIFSYDDLHQEAKEWIIWFLPIIALISAWANLLYVIRKSPFGIYIFMMTKILKSFAHVATIWIPTLIVFAFAFLLVMRDTGVKPWHPALESNITLSNMTFLQTTLVILQAITKTSAMMIGEVDADQILNNEANQWIPSILVLVFEIVTVILLMNLMVSIAVGEVSDLRENAQDKILKVKLSFVIEALQLSEQFPKWLGLHSNPTANVLLVMDDGSYISTTTTDKFSSDNVAAKTDDVSGADRVVIPPSGQPMADSDTPTTDQFSSDNVAAKTNDATGGVTNPPHLDKIFKISFKETGMRLRIQPITGGVKRATIRNCDIECVESSISGIPVIDRASESKVYEGV